MKIGKSTPESKTRSAEADCAIPSDPALVDQIFMDMALQEARQAAVDGEVPVGAVVVQFGALRDPAVIAKSHNRREALGDPTAHAEILALRAAGEVLGNWQLTDCDLYVTLEPCPMCAGALVNARIRRIIFGCRDRKAVAVGSLYNLPADERLNHRPRILEGVRTDEAAALLKAFFAARRKNGRIG